MNGSIQWELGNCLGHDPYGPYRRQASSRERYANKLKHLVLTLIFVAIASTAQATPFTDRNTFLNAVGALGLSAANENYETYPQGNLANGQLLGAFSYSYDTATTQPGVASNGAGGQALGDTSLGTDPNAGSGVFVSGEMVTLTHTGANLVAFGADFSYAPAFEDL